MPDEPVFTFPGEPRRRWRGWRLLLWPFYVLLGGAFIVAKMVLGIAFDFFRTTFGVIAAFVIVVALIGMLVHLLG